MLVYGFGCLAFASFSKNLPYFIRQLNHQYLLLFRPKRNLLSRIPIIVGLVLKFALILVRLLSFLLPIEVFAEETGVFVEEIEASAEGIEASVDEIVVFIEEFGPFVGLAEVFIELAEPFIEGFVACVELVRVFVRLLELEPVFLVYFERLKV